MAANRHTCLPALARQARLTGGSRAGRRMLINPPLPPAKAGQALQRGKLLIRYKITQYKIINK